MLNAHHLLLLELPDVVCNESKFEYPITSTMLKVKTGKSNVAAGSSSIPLGKPLVTEHGPEPGLPFLVI
jgi:hypothetical protein